MNFFVSTLQNDTDNEDEDYESYFLQPASSPYNIAEKVQQANIDLFSFNVNMEKTSRVTFREDLASFEPELTDDDVVSIESDPAESENLPENPQIGYKNVITLNIFDINEEEDETGDEEVIEEVETDDDLSKIEVLPSPQLSSNNNNTFQISDNKTSEEERQKKIVRKRSPNVCRGNNNIIECKNHCIEKLDFDLSMSIKKLEIREKPPNCPLLKLQKRKCCDENKVRNPANLPCYNGLRSEYGLTSTQLEKREKRKEIIKLKEQKRQQLMHEYKSRKNQQNEAVFCQWLEEIAKRKEQKQKIDGCKRNMRQGYTPNVINFPTKVAQERPKTANEFVPRQGIKRTRRPHTSPACVFIEVPPRLLHRGICVGDLLVNRSTRSNPKMHILAFS